MKKYIFHSLIAVCVLMASSCSDEQAPLPSDTNGLIAFGLSFSIDELPAGRVETVNTDDFVVTIFDHNDVEVLVIPRFADAPDSISLPTGTYYAEAHSNNLVNAAFENPFYSGRSSDFTVDKEEFKTIIIDTELSNVQVSFNFSQNVINDFDVYEGVVAISNSSDSLVFITGESRSGHFIPGNPLDIKVKLSYNKLDGGLVEQTFNSSIDDPKPKTHYRLNLDARLEDGRISLQINVDETVDVEDIDLKNPVMTFEKTLGGSGLEEASTVIQTLDGGFIISGHTFSTDGDVGLSLGGGDFWIIKTDAVGVIEWERSLGGSGFDFATDITQAPDGTYGVIGTSNSASGPNGSLGNNGLNDTYFVKLNSEGIEVGDRMIGGSFNDQGHSIDVTLDGGYVVTGASRSTNGDFSINRGNLDLFIAELSPVQFGFTSIDRLRSLGGSEFENGESVLQTSDGGYVVAGRTSSNDGDVVGANGGLQDFWVLKFDQFFNLTRQSAIGGFDIDIATDIKETPDQGFIVTGYTRSSNGDVTVNQGDYDYWVVKLGSNGLIQWQKTYGGSGEDRAESIALTADGGYVVAGYSNSQDGDVTGNNGSFDFWVLKVDDMGDVEWQNSLGGSGVDRAFSVSQTVDGGFIVAGHTTSSDGDVTEFKGASDIWIVKLDQNGNL